jgi:hypothetical protein
MAGASTSGDRLSSGLKILAASVTVAVALANIGINQTTSILYGIAAGCYVLALQRPVWALAPIIIAELAIPGYFPGTSLSTRLAFAMASSVLAAIPFLRSFQSRNASFQRVIVPAIAFLGIVTIMNVMHSETDYVYQYFRFQVTQVIDLILVAFLIRQRRDLKQIAVFTMILGAISGFAAISQHFATNSALYAAGSPGDIRQWSGRVVGLKDSPVILAADLPFVLMPILGILAIGPVRFDRPRLRLAALAGLVFLGCYFTYTRSAMPAIGVGLALIAFFLRGTRRIVLIGGLLFVVFLFPYLETTGLVGSRYYRDASTDTSAASHEAVWQVGLALALDHPLFGIGHDSFGEYALEYIEVVDEELVAVGGTAPIVAGSAHPHNDFLNVWFSWGIMALVIHIMLYIGALVNCRIAARSEDMLIRGLAIGTAGGLATYAANSALHNYLDSSAYLWLYAGLSVALVRLAAMRSQESDILSPMVVPRRKR